MKEMPSEHLYSRLDKLEYKSKECLYDNCTSSPITSHTIPENILYKIDPVIKNILTFMPKYLYNIKNDSKDKLIQVNKNKFSTFTGFCHKHDHELFKQIDQYDGEINHYKALLIHYRNICYGINHIHLCMRKEQIVREANYIGPEDLNHDMLQLIKSGQFKDRLIYCLNEHMARKKILEEMLFHNSYDDMCFTVCPCSRLNPIFFGRASYLINPTDPFFKEPGYSYVPWVSYITLIHGDQVHLIFCWLVHDNKYLSHFRKVLATGESEGFSFKDIIPVLGFGSSDAFAVSKDVYRNRQSGIDYILSNYRDY